MSPGSLALDRYRTLSEAILDAAQAQEWDDVVRLGDERDAVAASFPTDLSGRLPASEQVAARKAIDDCRSLDAQVRGLVEARQKELRVLLRVAAP